MKKFVVLLVVVAMTLISSVAFGEVTVGGELAIRSRSFTDLDMNKNANDSASVRDTQTRMKIDVNAKVGDVKGKLQLWNDFESWADNSIGKTTTTAPSTFETQPGSTVVTGATGTYEKNTIGFREAWISLPLGPVTLTGGHQLLTIGNGWFFRSQHYGSDAWVVSSKIGPADVAFVNVKFSEGAAGNRADDTDAYALIGAFKLNDNMTIGADITNLKTHGTDLSGLMNIGVNFNGKIGPVALKAEADFQMGEASATEDFAGTQFVVQGSVPVGPVGINFTAAVGSGEEAAGDIDEFQNALDVDPHYTFLYEYKMNTAAGAKNTGFANTTALGVGATFAATKNLTIGADFWLLTATEGAVDDIGQEIDVKVNWKVAENLTWNWVLGTFMPDSAFGADDATGIQGALVFKF